MAYEAKRPPDSAEVDEIEAVEGWFEMNLPNPPFYQGGNVQKAITWFKQETTSEMVDKIEKIREIVERDGWKIEIEFCEEIPGELVYEDELQIATI